MDEETSSLSRLPNEANTDRFPELGIEEIKLVPIELYEKLKEIPVNKRKNIRIVVACTGGAERSRIMGNIAKQMGFDVATILNPAGYHKKYAVPVDELLEPSTNAEFPDGKVKFSDFLDKPVDHIIVFTNEILDSRGNVEVKDNYTNRMINAISVGLYKSSETKGQKPRGVTFIRVPATERQVQQVERLFRADN
ncbi:MAG TPA: hypothetical protein VLE44_01140 [Candidatus Saccharimonadales bacterium]|nr:hypothetical protein [Candidatus Saccharimonadales bacterium]